MDTNIQHADQWKAIRMALEFGFAVHIDELERDLIDRGYTATLGTTRLVLRRVAVHYEWK